MSLVQIGLYLCLIFKICYAELTKDIEQTKSLVDGLELNNRELTQGDRDLAMFPEVYSKDFNPNHGDKSKSKGLVENSNRSPKTLSKGDVPTGSPARSSSAINSDRSSDDTSISSISRDKQRAHPLAPYNEYNPGYGDAAHQHLQDQLNHYQDNYGFNQHEMHPPIMTWNLNPLPAPDVLIQLPGFSNAADAAMHSPVGQAMAVSYSTPGFIPDHMQAASSLYNNHLPYGSHLGYHIQPSPFSPSIDPMSHPQNLWPSHILNSQNVPTGSSKFYGSRNPYKKPPSKSRVQGPSRTKSDDIEGSEQPAVPRKPFQHKTKESERGSDPKHSFLKEDDQAQPSLPRPEAMKSLEESKLNAPKSSEESIPIAPNEPKLDLAVEGKSKTSEELEYVMNPIMNPISAETSGSVGHHVENSDKATAEVKPITPRLWADIASQKVNELPRSSLEKENHKIPQDVRRPLVKDIKFEKATPQLGSKVNPETRKLKPDVVADLKSNSEEWKEYHWKKGRKGRFVGRKSAQANAVQNHLDSHQTFVLPDESSLLGEAKTHTPAPDKGSMVEASSQETMEPQSEDVPHTSTQVPDEYINLISDAPESKSAITGKTKTLRKKQKPKSRKTRPNAQVDRYQGLGNIGTPANGLASESVKPENLSSPPNDEDPAAQLDAILSKALQKDNKRERIRIDFDESSYEKLSKINPLSDEVWSQFRNEFHSDFDNPYEAHRRWNALANQMDQRIATKHWKDLAPMLSEPIKEVALRFKIDEEWPTFDAVDMAYGEETMIMLDKLNKEDQGTLATLFGNKLFRVRLATVYVTSRRSHNAKQFQKSQLVDFMKRGGMVPSLYEIHDCLEMKSAGVNWDNLSKEELASRLDRIVKAMTGRISIGDKNLELTKQDWSLTYTREYLLRQGAATNTVDFALRFKKFADKVNSELEPRSILSWWGIPESERANYPTPDWATEFLTPAQVLAAANFDLTIRWVGMMIHASKQVAKRQEDLDQKMIYWPVNAPDELGSKFAQFKQYYRFLGFELKSPNQQNL